MRTLLARDGLRFSEMLLAADQSAQAAEAVTETFIAIIEYGRQYQMAAEVVHRDAGPLALAAVSTLEQHLVAHRAILPAHARIAAETVVRLTISVLIRPATAMDFHNDDEWRRFALRVIPPLLEQL